MNMVQEEERERRGGWYECDGNIKFGIQSIL